MGEEQEVRDAVNYTRGMDCPEEAPWMMKAVAFIKECVAARKRERMERKRRRRWRRQEKVCACVRACVCCIVSAGMCVQLSCIHAKGPHLSVVSVVGPADVCHVRCERQCHCRRRCRRCYCGLSSCVSLPTVTQHTTRTHAFTHTRPYTAVSYTHLTLPTNREV